MWDFSSLCWVLPRDGIQKAKARGVRFGKKKALAPEQVVALRPQRERGVLVKTLMRDYALSKASVYRYLRAIDTSQSAQAPSLLHGVGDREG